MSPGRSLRTRLRWLLFWPAVVLLLVYLPFWALAEWLHARRHNRKMAGCANAFNEALSGSPVMDEGKPLVEPDELVAILPEYSPSMHRVDVFDPEARAVQMVTRAEAESAGFTPCVRCWCDVEPIEPKTLEELGKIEEEDQDE